MTESAITPGLVAKHGVTPEEYKRIRQILRSEDGRLIFASILCHHEAVAVN
jgi:hypothetical protein